MAGVAVGRPGAMALAGATELVVVRPVQKRAGRANCPALVAVAAVLFAIQQLAGLVFGYVTLPGQQLVTFDPVKIGDAPLQPSAVLLLAMTVVVFAAAARGIRYTRGRPAAARGRRQHSPRPAARPAGEPDPADRVPGVGLLAGIAGMLFAPKAGVGSLRAGWTLTGFLAMVVGGTGSCGRRCSAGCVLGGVEVFVPYYFGGQSHVYGMLLVALVFFAFKPEGLFVRRVGA